MASSIKFPKTMGDGVDDRIVEAIQGEFGLLEAGDYKPDTEWFAELISMGELIDRLSIVNLKLFDLKRRVMERQDDKEFLAQSAVVDVHLCKERSRLKNCIDVKLGVMISDTIDGAVSFNPEQKAY